jgi:hypothetical protein
MDFASRAMKTMFWLGESRQPFPSDILLSGWLFSLMSISPPGTSHPCVGPLHTQESVRPYNALRSISGACLRGTRAKMRCLVLLRWVWKYSDLIPGRWVSLCRFRPLSTFTMLTSILLTPMQVSAHPKVIE